MHQEWCEGHLNVLVYLVYCFILSLSLLFFFLYFLSVVKYINIKFTILTTFKCTIQWMELSTFTLLCN